MCYIFFFGMTVLVLSTICISENDLQAKNMHEWMYLWCNKLKQNTLLSNGKNQIKMLASKTTELILPIVHQMGKWQFALSS